MLELLEQQQKLTRHQWLIAGAATLGDMLDYFDFLLIGFVVAFIVKDWHLTYGQSGAVLFASGVAAPFGSSFYGRVADKLGRRVALIGGILNVSIATGAMALTPNGAWIYLVLCRLFVGFGTTGLKPGVTTAALVPGFAYFAAWYLLGAIAFAFIAMETSARTIDEIDAALDAAPHATAS